MNITDKTIRNIAGEIDCGMKCYIHKKTGECKSIPDELRLDISDTDLWDEDIKKIEANLSDYIEIGGMSSHDSFRVMEGFAGSVDDSRFQDKLINALNRSKPFRNFKWEIDNSAEYRDKWFDFKAEKGAEHVKQQIKFSSNPDEW